MKQWSRIAALTAALFPVLTAPTLAQTEEEATLAKAAQNPLASVISTPIQWNSNFGMGQEGKTQNVVLLQPVVPFALSSGVTLITRHILPIVNQPAITGEGPSVGGPIILPPPDVEFQTERKTGLGDYSGTFWLAPAGTGDLTWGLGATLLVPTATEGFFGAGKWGAGPSAVLVWMPGSWVTAAIVSNTWSFAGDEDRGDVNQFFAQLVANYNLADGWYLSSAPVITANWEAENEDRWTVPIGGGGGRVFRIGQQPSDFRVSAFGYLAKPEGGPDWTLQIQWKLMFPK